eukprot:CAMPEP_0201521336 /NCGR_PEP_ID=MMETSP0161_2-20130828/14365_1 /ASSEMBLY_ACC=CAM_ASM_000251 /TAXON_ID=180227 /ORGANISM="Neoparamoeba aestuarina, Strain SoJaBio B1-5/56/2" /LENGTH=129 /DNA_ID=CAMNT_0047919959 /DNA_START=76 /DNA_END=461 /DNA_ORIENTATION=-
MTTTNSKDNLIDFHDACKNGNLDVVETLIEVDPAVLRKKDQFGNTGFHLACFHHQVDVIKLIMKEDLTVASLKNKDGETGQEIATKQGHSDIAQLFLLGGPFTFCHTPGLPVFNLGEEKKSETSQGGFG